MVSYVSNKGAPYCLPKKDSAAFLAALQNGTLDINQLKQLSSEDRRAAFGKVLGDDNAKEVNTLFESKLLLKNQKKAMLDWVNQLAGLSQPIRKTIEDQILSLDKVLNPVDKKSFLADLANKKLGAAVTDVEAKAIFDQAKVVSDLKTDFVTSMTRDNPAGDQDKRIAYGLAQVKLLDTVEEMKPNGRTFAQHVTDIMGLPKSFQTSIGHLSAMAVQLTGAISTKAYWQGAYKMLGFFAKEENYDIFRAWSITHPKYNSWRAAGLQITQLGNDLNKWEEGIQTHYLEQINNHISDKTGAFNIIKASNRAFTGSQNYTRISLYDTWTNAAKAAGEDVRDGSPACKEIAKVINDFTGRGALGKGDKYANASTALNVVLWSVRKFSALVNVLNPYEYLKPYESKTARYVRYRLLAGTIMTFGAITMLLRSSGYSVDTNPISQGFMKAVSPGGEKYDWAGPFPGAIRLMSRILTGRMINANGKETEFAQSVAPSIFGDNKFVGHYVTKDKDGNYHDAGEDKYAKNRLELTGEYFRGLLAPVVSILVNAMAGSDPVGNDFSVPAEIRHHMEPINISQFINYYYENPQDTADVLPSLISIFGVGLQSPLAPQVKQGMNVWGDEVNQWSFHDPVRTKLDQELDQIGVHPQFPYPSIGGVKLTDQQYQDYIKISGSFAKDRLSDLFDSPKFQAAPTPLKKQAIDGIFSTGRSKAIGYIQAKYHDTKDDIIKPSNELWKQKNGFTTPEEGKAPE